jgi:peptidoglycan hydrolase-like protein with peptidoglycan-binding domain
VPEGGESGRAGEQPAEQRQRPTKEQIQQVQGRLNAMGLDPGPVDGTLGPQTETALRTYQQRQGLPISGLPDEATVRTLLAAGSATEGQRSQVLPATPCKRRKPRALHPSPGQSSSAPGTTNSTGFRPRTPSHLPLPSPISPMRVRS